MKRAEEYIGGTVWREGAKGLANREGVGHAIDGFDHLVTDDLDDLVSVERVSLDLLDHVVTQPVSDKLCDGVVVHRIVDRLNDHVTVNQIVDTFGYVIEIDLDVFRYFSGVYLDPLSDLIEIHLDVLRYFGGVDLDVFRYFAGVYLLSEIVEGDIVSDILDGNLLRDIVDADVISNVTGIYLYQIHHRFLKIGVVCDVGSDIVDAYELSDFVRTGQTLVNVCVDPLHERLEWGGECSGYGTPDFGSEAADAVEHIHIQVQVCVGWFAFRLVMFTSKTDNC